MNDIDAALTKLAREPTPSLQDMQSRVLARVGANTTTRSSAGIELLVVGAALAMGVAGASLTARPARAEASLAPLGGHSPLAPSTLLIDVP